MINKEPLRPPELLNEGHDTSDFSCGNPFLNRYIKRYALVNQRNEISRTYVATRGVSVVGYYALAFGSMSHNEATQEIKEELPPHPIPIILLARLAVDQREQGAGLGKGLLRDALLRTVQAADIGGLRAMLTHAKDDEAKTFYKRYGFVESPIEPLTLMLPIKDIRENLK
jgi:GNAT superfamily N-acetyltransferase